jgi:acyl-coenzyme A synthetase/AMP-(fatty) acid ligase
VAFAVGDGRAGFPASLIEQRGAAVELTVVDGSLRVRSARTASRYLGSQGESLRDADGFVDTGDMVERRGDRYHFVGRRGGIINVGGLKVHPEEVEAVINDHPRVRMSLVRTRKSPITGAIVVADVVVNGAYADLATELLELCRRRLPRHKVPAAITFVPSLTVAATGKIARPDA